MISKTGSPGKIQKVSKTADEFNQLSDSIAKENNLVRCSCGKLLSKLGTKGCKAKTLKHRGLSAIVKDGGNILVKCPQCEAVIKIE